MKQMPDTCNMACIVMSVCLCFVLVVKNVLLLIRLAVFKFQRHLSLKHLPLSTHSRCH